MDYGEVYIVSILRLCMEQARGMLFQIRSKYMLLKDDAPAPRVGAGMTFLDGAAYVWGGRGGIDMSPLGGKQAGMWRIQLGSNILDWERLKATNEDHAPEPRSYHTMIA